MIESRRSARTCRSGVDLRPLALLAILLAALLAGASEAQAADCIDYREYIQAVGSLDLPDSAEDIALSGRYAYVAATWHGLMVVDISDATAPALVADVDLADFAAAVAIVGNFAYVAGHAGLQVVDISNPTRPFITGRIAMPNPASKVAVAGSHLLVVAGDLQVVNIEDPVAPTLVGRIPLPGFEIRNVTVTGDVACVAAVLRDRSHSFLFLVDISNPAAPSIIGRIRTGMAVYCAAAAGPYVYVAHAGDPMLVVDISIPSAPIVVGSVDAPAGDVAVFGNLVYLAGRHLCVVDVADPTSPQLLVAALDEMSVIAVAGDFAYCYAWWCGLLVVDISHPAAPTMLGRMPTPPSQHLAFSGRYAYAATWDSFHVIDVSRPSAPTIIGSLQAQAGALALDGNRAYVTTRSGLQVVDVSDPTAMSVVAKLSIAGDYHPNGVAIAGDHAYVTMFDGGFVAVDISVPEQPRFVARIPTPFRARVAAVAIGHAFLISDHRLLIADVRNPGSPSIVGAVDLPGVVHDLVIDGRYAYCIAGDRLHIMDIWQPASPEIVGSFSLHSARSVGVAGHFAYVTSDTTPLAYRVVDVSDRAAPHYAGSGNSWYRHASVKVAGELVYVIDRGRTDIYPAQCVEPAPELELRAVQNPYLTQKLDLLLKGSDPLAPSTVRMRLGDTEIPLVAIEAGENTWAGPFELTADSLSTSLFACATSAAGTDVCVERPLTARLFRQGEATTITSPDARLAITLHEPGLGSDGYIVVMPGGDSGNSPFWEVSPRGLLNGATATLEVSYVDADVTDPSSLHIEELTGGPLESVVDTVRHTVSATIGELGTFRLAEGPVSGPASDGPVHDRAFLTVEPNVPNPFNPETTIHFEIGATQRVHVAVYDTQGREIAELADRVLAAGVHRVMWNGRIRDGLAAASGVYIVRVTTENATAARKMLLVR